MESAPHCVGSVRGGSNCAAGGQSARKAEKTRWSREARAADRRYEQVPRGKNHQIEIERCRFKAERASSSRHCKRRVEQSLGCPE
eukprot:6207105-Pleurochrysis_carterae.AAC.6